MGSIRLGPGNKPTKVGFPSQSLLDKCPEALNRGYRFPKWKVPITDHEFRQALRGSEDDGSPQLSESDVRPSKRTGRLRLNQYRLFDDASLSRRIDNSDRHTITGIGRLDCAVRQCMYRPISIENQRLLGYIIQGYRGYFANREDTPTPHLPPGR